jgi:BirA family biotin operon repressor/biotin-[acetyl-CoA-carboxylase] ligase
MDAEQGLVAALADGAWHSVEELAASLPCSPSELSQIGDGLARLGLRMEVSPARGYRLAGAVELLDNHLIYKYIYRDTAALIADVELLWETDSTNGRLLMRAASQDVHAHVCVAEFQRAGRGRQGRAWHASLGSGLCLSIAWRFAGNLDHALSLAVGVALARSLKRIGAHDIALKWPNDVLWQERKLAGILVERRLRSNGDNIAVIGIGVNVDCSAGCTGETRQDRVDLRTVLGQAVSRNRLVGEILNDLCAVLAACAHGGFAAFIAEWRSLDALYGRAVKIHLPTETLAGQAAGIDENGAFLATVNDKQQRFYAADVSVRLQS